MVPVKDLWDAKEPTSLASLTQILTNGPRLVFKVQCYTIDCQSQRTIYYAYAYIYMCFMCTTVLCWRSCTLWRNITFRKLHITCIIVCMVVSQQNEQKHVASQMQECYVTCMQEHQHDSNLIYWVQERERNQSRLGFWTKLSEYHSFHNFLYKKPPCRVANEVTRTSNRRPLPWDQQLYIPLKDVV